MGWIVKDTAERRMRARDGGVKKISGDGLWRRQGNGTSDEDEGETKINDRCQSHPGLQG